MKHTGTMTNEEEEASRRAGLMVDEFLASCRKHSGGEAVNVAMMTFIAEMVAHNTWSEAQQDKYLEWLVAGVEAVLQGNGRRKTARRNPLAFVDPGFRQ